jgi:hypothetical protein
MVIQRCRLRVQAGKGATRAGVSCLALLLLAAALAGCTPTPGQGGGGPAAGGPVALESEQPNPGTSTAPGAFAGFAEVPVRVSPAVKPYQVAPDLSNITNKDMFTLSPAARNLFIKNGFVVVPNSHFKEFFALYEMNRYAPRPLFVTTDSLLHNYHLFFSHLLRVMEEESFAPDLKRLTQSLLERALQDLAALKGTAWENAARRNVAFLAVAARLLDLEAPVPGEVRKVVEAELTLIDRHREWALSPVMNLGSDPDPVEGLKEDYSQYLPRGHYDKSDLLKSYFKAMMWYGRLTFRAQNEDETRSAVLLTRALDQAGNPELWARIYEPTKFLVGQSDDPTYPAYRELLLKVYGPAAGLKTLVEDRAKWSQLVAAVRDLKPPAINSLPIFAAGLQPDRDRGIRGFRLMGQRFTLDAAIFQRLVYRDVGENSRGERRMLPRGLDIAAAMGSQEAYKILQAEGETDYARYPENMERLRRAIAGLDPATWTQNLYWGWLYTLLPLTWEKPEGYPSFMRNPAWARKELSTYLAGWTELKHDTLLYAKQVYAEAGGGDQVDDRGYVEPNPYVYARLAALAQMTREGLRARQLISERDQVNLARLEQLALALKTISEKELNSAPLTAEDYELIRSYGASLEHFWLEALRDEGVDHPSAQNDRPAALVADVATDIGGGRVLEEATGPVFPIYVAVPVDGKLRIAVGGVYSYYEFPWPLADRLTDKKWHQLINEGQAPPQPAWTKSFTAPPAAVPPHA